MTGIAIEYSLRGDFREMFDLYYFFGSLMITLVPFSGMLSICTP